MDFGALAFSDYAVVILYLIAVLLAGFWFTRANKTGSDFFVGSNQIPWWAAGISLYMTTFSAWIFTGAASFVYNTGWYGFLYFALKPIGFLIGFLLAAKRWRRARVTSPVEYVEERYNHSTRLVLSVVLVISMMYWPAHHLASVAKIAAPALFPGSAFAVDGLILFFGVFVLVYSIAGGIWAVSMTDVLQFVVLLSVCIVLIVTISGADDLGGLGTALASLPAIEFTHSFRPGTVYTHWYVWGFIVAGIFGTVVGDKAQRFFIVKDERAAIKTGWLAMALFLTSPILFGIPPLIGKVLWPEVAQLAQFAGTSKPDESIFIAVVLRYLPAGVVGLFIAAMVAASMSALDSVWNTVSSIVSVDLYKGHLRPNATEQELLKIGRITVLFLACSAVGMALLIVNSSLGIFTISNMVLGLVGIPVTIPLMVGLVSRVPSTWSAIPSILTGIIIAIVTRFAFNWTLGPQYLLVITACLIVLFYSRWLGRQYLENSVKAIVLMALVWTLFFGVAGLLTVPTMEVGVFSQALFDGSILWLAVATAAAVVVNGLFIRSFASELQNPVPAVTVLFERLERPVDVAAEVGQSEIGRPNRIIGWSSIGLACIPVTLLLIHGLSEWKIYVMLSVLLLAIGAVFLLMGSSNEEK